MTPYPQPRFYDPVSSRTFDSSRSHDRSHNSKRFHFSSASAADDHGHHAQHHREDRLLHQHHAVHHSHHNEIIERIDEVIELVDCGGRDLGFCDMSSKYPGHMMGNLMSDCQELVYSGFVPVPDDLDELGDSNPVAKYSNSSKSTVRAQTGSWSWKPYTYESKQVCDSELRFIRPGYARDSTGKWQVVVQTEDLPQRVAIDLCHSPGKPCECYFDSSEFRSSFSLFQAIPCQIVDVNQDAFSATTSNIFSQWIPTTCTVAQRFGLSNFHPLVFVT